MKYIVMGLGFFGSTLAIDLTSQGHEVIGIDNGSHRTEEFKDLITTVMKMDTTNVYAVKTLPLEDADAVIVAIGADIGSSVLTLSILRNLNVKRIIGRVINPVHQNILNQMGISETVHPEEDSAMMISSLLQVKNALKVYHLEDNFVVAEIRIPEKYIGHTIDVINLEQRFNVKIVAVKSKNTDSGKGLLIETKPTLDYSFDSKNPLLKENTLIIAGKIENVKRIMD